MVDPLTPEERYCRDAANDLLEEDAAPTDDGRRRAALIAIIDRLCGEVSHLRSRRLPPDFCARCGEADWCHDTTPQRKGANDLGGGVGCAGYVAGGKRLADLVAYQRTALDAGKAAVLAMDKAMRSASRFMNAVIEDLRTGRPVAVDKEESALWFNGVDEGARATDAFQRAYEALPR